MKQSDLASQAGISASYLNLIEHNKRRIGGKVLIEIARTLEVDVSKLTEGAEEELLDGLREAAASVRRDRAEVDRIEEFVARFPGWASLIEVQRRRIAGQEHRIEALNDRLTHDPFLSEAMHDLVSNVTAIRSTATILAQTPEIERAWRDRFHRNLDEDSGRLAEGSEALMAYFDTQIRSDRAVTTPLEAFEALLAENSYHLPTLETGDMQAAEALVDSAQQLGTPQARRLALGFMQEYVQNAQAMPLSELEAALGDDLDPSCLARKFGVSLARMMLRLALLPAKAVGRPIGLVICDEAGALLLRKPLDGFPMPRFGAACPLWPLFRALHRPMEPLSFPVETPSGRQFKTYSFAAPVASASFDAPPSFRSTMLVVDLGEGASAPGKPIKVGMACRTCAHRGCDVRREPSILDSE
jgi:transcriptional regulator with XRE-family HTH domain